MPLSHQSLTFSKVLYLVMDKNNFFAAYSDVGEFSGQVNCPFDCR